MQCETARERLVDGLSGASPNDRASVEQHLAECVACREESATLSRLWEALGAVGPDAPDAAATARMRGRLDAMVTLSDAGRSSRRVLYGLQAMAAIVVLALGLAVGRYTAPPSLPSSEIEVMRQELQDLRHMVTLSLMQQQSATDRLKGVSWSGQIEAPRNDIVQALLDTLANDPNVNVRLASLDALERFADREVVRRAAVDAVQTQMSPLVQIALIDFIVKTGERNSLDVLKRIADDPKVHEAVRARAAWGVGMLG
jgi:hypothetical protein